MTPLVARYEISWILKRVPSGNRRQSIARSTNFLENERDVQILNLQATDRAWTVARDKKLTLQYVPLPGQGTLYTSKNIYILIGIEVEGELSCKIY